MKDELQPRPGPGSQNGARPSANGSNGPAAKSGNGPLAAKCPNCKELLLLRDLEKHLDVCPRCGHHFRLPARRRVELVADEGSFEDLTPRLQSADPLHFVSGSQSYRQKLDGVRAEAEIDEAAIMGRGRIEDLPAMLVVMDFRFIGGSMGSVVGEVVTQAIERAAGERLPLITFSTSGGARMQEGLISLMQMAKTAAALARLAAVGVPYISVLTDPTTGGVAASFAFLGDVILAEPKTLIGFAGPRVIEQFMHRSLPKDTNTAEFVLQHGMIDGIVHRRALKPTLTRLLRMYAACPPASSARSARSEAQT